MLTKVLLLILILNPPITFCLEPLSGITVFLGALASSYYFGKQIKWPWSQKCNFHFDKDKFQRNLTKYLFGQHLVSLLVMNAIQSHLYKTDPKKALVMTFHGWTGSGKNHVAKMLAENLYGDSTQFVHWYIATKDFPPSGNIKSYRNRLIREVTENSKICDKSLFIFDEVDKIPPGVLDGLKPFLDFYEDVDGIDFRKNIFIFISNTGGSEITKVSLNFWLDGKDREDISIKDIETSINQDAFNEKGGLQHSDIIKRNLIDVYIPFLPLEKTHIRQCIRIEMMSRNLSLKEKIIDLIADQMNYYPADLELYCTSGCKKVSHKIDLYGDIDDIDYKKLSS